MGRRAPAALLVLALSFLLARPSAGDAKSAAEETKQLGKIAALWVEAGGWFGKQGRKAELVRAVAEARAASPTAEGLADLDALVDSVAEASGPDPKADERWAKTAADAAKAYEKLAGLTHDAKDDARFDGYLLKAAELEPSKGRLGKLAAAVQQAAGNRGRTVGAGRMLVRLRTLDPSEANQAKCDAIERDLAQSDLALVRGKDHDAVAWLSLPKGAPAKGTPDRVLVCVDGAGANFVGVARAFRDGRGSRRYAVLSPCALSCTNELKAETFPYYDPALLDAWNGKRLDFDLPGLEAVLDVLKERYGLAGEVAVTGFSGGGNLAYGLLFRRPARVFAAAPACANFVPGIAEPASPVEGGGPPVHVLTGAKDQYRDEVNGQAPGIEGQSDWAMEAFKRLGFSNVRRTMLPGVGHSSCVREVWSFLDEVAAKK